MSIVEHVGFIVLAFSTLQQVISQVDAGEISPDEAEQLVRVVPPQLRCVGTTRSFEKHAANLSRSMGLARNHQDMRGTHGLSLDFVYS
jgi:hypothetical protein